MEAAESEESMLVCFEVSEALEPGELLHVVGGPPELGAWDPYSAWAFRPAALEGSCPCCTSPTSVLVNQAWTTQVLMRKVPEFEYRFFVGRYLEDWSPEQRGQERDVGHSQCGTCCICRLVVVRWETNISPRHFSSSSPGLQRIVNEETGLVTYRIGVQEFGHIEGLRHISRGWLMGQTEVRLRMTKAPFYMWKAKNRAQIYSIKCTAMDYHTQQVARQGDDDEVPEGPPVSPNTHVHVCVLDDGRQFPQLQGQFGVVYQEDDFMEFRIQNFNQELVGFMFDLYVHREGRDQPRHVGTAHLLPFTQQQREGKLVVPIIGLNHRPIGELHGEYLIVKPFPNHTLMQMHETFQSHWKSTGRSLDVGHRGMGSSYKQMSMCKENTLHSLNSAGVHGADLVEFDVMLTKEKEVVIYHDFTVCLCYHSREGIEVSNSKEELFEIPVKDLTKTQLQKMKLSHVSSMDGLNIELHGRQRQEQPLDQQQWEEEHHWEQPFPDLAQALEELDPRLGFNIEIKYPMQDEKGHWEMLHYFERNECVDHILDVVFKHKGKRKIIFSSFDPDCCVMLQMKQNRYPVLLLSTGPTKKYTPYMDFRARDFNPGIYFAQAEALLGLDLSSESLLHSLDVIRRIKEAGLVIFVWGEECNNKDNLDLLRKHGVDGLIYDRMDTYHPSVFNISSDENLALVELAAHSHVEQEQAALNL